MKPSRTRAERSQPQQKYLTQEELKLELHRQAKEKRQEKMIEQIQEKEQILQHYQNYQISGRSPQEEAELAMFLQANKEQLNKEIQERVMNNPSIKPERKKEQERLQRLKLREEERLRRLNGLGSAFDDKKDPLPFQIEKQLKENINNNNHFNPIEERKRQVKEDLFTPFYEQQQNPIFSSPIDQQNQIFTYEQPPLRAERKVIQAVQVNQPLEVIKYDEPQIPPRRIQSQQGQQNEMVMPPRPPSQRISDSYQRMLNEPENSERTQKDREADANREKQRKYREELDRQVNQKKNVQMDEKFKPYSQQNPRIQQQTQDDPQDDFYSKFGQQATRSQNQFQRQQADPKQIEVNKKKQYADELMQQIIQKEKNKGSFGSQDQGLQQQQNYQNQINSPSPYSSPNYQPQTQQFFPPQQEMDPQQRNFARKGTITNLGNEDSDRQRIQKQKYADELRKQVEERNQNKKQREIQEKEREARDWQNVENVVLEERRQIENFQKQRQQEIQDYQFVNQQAAMVQLEQRQKNKDYLRNDNYYQQQQPEFQPQQQQYFREEEQFQSRQQQNSYNSQRNNNFQQEVQQPSQNEEKNYARKGVFAQIHGIDDAERQRIQKQKYAEELRRQVEEQGNKKKEQERLDKEREAKEWQRVEQALEEEKKLMEQKKQQKQAEVFEHQVANKQVAQLRKPETRQQSIKNDLFGPTDNKQIDLLDYQQDQQQPLSSFDKIIQGAQSQPDQAPKYSQQIPLNYEEYPMQAPFTPQNQMMQQIQPIQQIMMPQFQPIPNMGLINTIQSPLTVYPYIQPQQGLFYNLPYQIQQNQFQEQVQMYQNALFAPPNVASMQPQNMQIHYSYLMQLQQSKQEIEVVRKILEEKLRIQQLEVQNQMLVEQYRMKVRDIQQEQLLFEKEINKLKAYLHDKKPKDPLNPQVFASALYMSILGNKQQNQIQHLLPQHAQPQMEIQEDFQKWSAVEQDQDYQLNESQFDGELPASSDYVPCSESTIWQDLQHEQEKSFMPELNQVKQSFSQEKQSELNLDDFQMYSQDESQVNSHIQVDGFDVNMLRTQDYLNMFKENIQSHKSPGLAYMLHKNSKNLESNINTSKAKKQIGQSNQFQRFNQPGNSTYTDAISQFESNIQRSVAKSILSDLNEEQQDLRDSIAMSASVRESQIQRPQEVLMDEAKFLNDPTSLILPDDDIDDDKLQNFIQSHEQDEMEIVKPTIQFLNTIQIVKENQMPPIQKPLTSYDQRTPQTPGSNHVTNRSDADQSFRKYKKPKTIDIFSKLPSQPKLKSNNKQNQQFYEENKSQNNGEQMTLLQKQSIELLKEPFKQQKAQMDEIRQQYIQTPEPISVLNKLIQNKSPQEEQPSIVNQHPLPSNIFSNCTQMNPLTSYTTFIAGDRRAEQIVNRLDNFLSNMEQSETGFTNKINMQPIKGTSRKAKELSQARKEDSVLNHLDILRESQEESPYNNSRKSLQYEMFKYDEEIQKSRGKEFEKQEIQVD